MTTLVKIEVSKVNVGPGKVFAAIVNGSNIGAAVYDCPMKQEFWIHGEGKVVVREATWSDLDTVEGKTVPAHVEPAPAPADSKVC